MAERLLHDQRVADLRRDEYPMLRDSVYLDHAGTTLYAKSLIEAFSHDMMSNLYGNPHSASPSSQLSTRQVEDCRLTALRLFDADPDHFDLVFVANATAGIKLVQDAFMAHPQGFWYGYHVDSHTSLVGVREGASAGHRCFMSDYEFESAIVDSENSAGFKSLAQSLDGCARPQAPGSESSTNSSYSTFTSTSMPGSWDSTRLPDEVGDHTAAPQLELFAYPAQSNMDGRRLPLAWSHRVRSETCSSISRRRYTLLDAAALVSTAPLSPSDAGKAPDFTVVSFYKMFGFPDLGALLVRKEAAQILRRRRYFGGDTVDAVTCSSGHDSWHVPRTSSLHAALEDGTLPIHNIIALGHAIRIHEQLYGSFSSISKHTAFLANHLYKCLSGLTHANGHPVCKVHAPTDVDYNDSTRQGPIIAFNLRDSRGAWVSNTEVERLASLHNIHLRSGGLCNPGGVARSLGISPQASRRNFSAGYRCGGEVDIVDGKPTGALRVSLGAMSTLSDVDTFLDFLGTFFVESDVAQGPEIPAAHLTEDKEERYALEELIVYPIKSCAGWTVPRSQSLEVSLAGLAWDREWCLIQTGTGEVLNQKKVPRMALLRPRLDFKRGLLHVTFEDPLSTEVDQALTISISLNRGPYDSNHAYNSSNPNPVPKLESSTSCSGELDIVIDTTPAISTFFTNTLGITCQLARSFNNRRHAPGVTRHADPTSKPSRSLANESPILAITTTSLDRLNNDIHARHHGLNSPPPPIPASTFRPNAVLRPLNPEQSQIPSRPYTEDHWSSLRLLQQPTNVEQDITCTEFEIHGPCRRCQMVCIDQRTAERRKEPFVTLAKTRRKDGGGVWFGVGIGLATREGSSGRRASIRVGDEFVARVGGAVVDE